VGFNKFIDPIPSCDLECEMVTKCNHLKMRAADGKMRVTDMADTEK